MERELQSLRRELAAERSINLSLQTKLLEKEEENATIRKHAQAVKRVMDGFADDAPIGVAHLPADAQDDDDEHSPWATEGYAAGETGGSHENVRLSDARMGPNATAGDARSSLDVLRESIAVNANVVLNIVQRNSTRAAGGAAGPVGQA